jgi:hypothetical protein
MKVGRVGAELFHADGKKKKKTGGRADITKISRSSQFYEGAWEALPDFMRLPKASLNFICVY